MYVCVVCVFMCVCVSVSVCTCTCIGNESVGQFLLKVGR